MIGIAAETAGRADLVGEGHHMVDVEADADALADGVVVMARHQRQNVGPAGQAQRRGCRRRGKPCSAPGAQRAGVVVNYVVGRSRTSTSQPLAGFAGRPATERVATLEDAEFHAHLAAVEHRSIDEHALTDEVRDEAVLGPVIEVVGVSHCWMRPWFMMPISSARRRLRVDRG